MLSESTIVDCIGIDTASNVIGYAAQLQRLSDAHDFGDNYRTLLRLMASQLLDWRWDGTRYVERYWLPNGQVVRSVGETIAAWASVKIEIRKASKGNKHNRVAVY